MEENTNKKNRNLAHEITVKDILEVTKGKLINASNEEGAKDIETLLNTVCNKFVKDTRDIKGGEIYIGLLGEKTNGGVYYEQALENGALGIIVQDIQITKEQQEKYKEKILINVEDTLDALQKIAMLKREKYSNVKIIAITGSVGKCTKSKI